MRIVHVLNGSSTDAHYGVEEHVLTLAGAQKRRGHAVMAVTHNRAYFAEACEQRGVPTVVDARLKPLGHPAPSLDERTIESLCSRFREFRADIIHCHTPFPALLAIPAANRAGIPCFFTVHIEVPSGFFPRTRHLRFTVIAVSADVLAGTKKAISSDVDLYFVPHGTAIMPPELTANRGTEHRRNLLMAGYLHSVKGQDVAIMALFTLRKRLRQDCPILNIYGSGPPSWSDYLREMVTALGLTDLVYFHGNRPGILRDCPAGDILIVASRSETGPIVVLEAMSRGMPIVASDVGEVREMLPDERYGRIVPVNSITALAGAIESTLQAIDSGQFDPELLVARHRSFFSDAVMSERIEEIYERAMETISR